MNAGNVSSSDTHVEVAGPRFLSLAASVEGDCLPSSSPVSISRASGRCDR